MSENIKCVTSADGLVHFPQPEPTEVHVQIENKSEWDKEQLWNELKEGIITKYKERGIDFDPNTITNKESLDNAANVLSDIEKKEKAERDVLTKPAPVGGETAMWDSNQVNGESYPSDSEGVPVDMLEAENPQQLIQILNSRKDPESKLALNKLNSKVVKGKGINWEYNGKLLDLIKGDIIINENDPDNVKIAKAQKNERTRRSRTNWRDLNQF